MSEKNMLQEFCQKNKIPMPIYKSWHIGKPHKLEWSGNVTIKLNNEDITINTLVNTNSKVAAEKQAAIMMLDYIRTKKNKNNINKISQISKFSHITIYIISTQNFISEYSKSRNK